MNSMLIAPGGRRTPAFALLCAALFALPGLSSGRAVTVEESPYGKMPDGTEVRRFTIANGRGLEADVITLGATLTTVRRPDRDGNPGSITLHKESLEGYLAGHPFYGSLVGRYANRIAGAAFEIDGERFDLVANSGEHHIHGGGQEGFAWKVWEAKPIRGEDFAGVELTLTSPDGEAGYPGTVQARVTYKLTTKNELVMDYEAETDAATHVNLTNHAYWNLGGVEGGEQADEVLDHVVTLNADHYLPADEDLIPTGEIRAVAGTPLDFNEPHAIGERVEQVDLGFYDHCYVINRGGQGGDGEDTPLAFTARVSEPDSGRVMEVFTTEPGVQLYTGNTRGLCLEAQHFPDSPNKPNFPSTLLRPGETYRQTTLHRFGVLEE